MIILTKEKIQKTKEKQKLQKIEILKNMYFDNKINYQEYKTTLLYLKHIL